jgi:hypothetical protein
MGEVRIADSILVRKPERNKRFGTHGGSWEDECLLNCKYDKEHDVVDWLGIGTHREGLEQVMIA